MSFASLIKRLQDIMRKDSGVDGDAQRLAQIVWLIFLKVYDYKEEEAELDDNYVPVIPKGYRWRDWAVGASLTPPTIEIVGFLGGAARFIAKPCLKQRVMRFPIIHYGCSA